MRIKLLEIQNFKGIAQLVIQADGHNVTITGQNGAGKNSIPHAWLFVYFSCCLEQVLLVHLIL